MRSPEPFSATDRASMTVHIVRLYEPPAAPTARATSKQVRAMHSAGLLSVARRLFYHPRAATHLLRGSACILQRIVSRSRSFALSLRTKTAVVPASKWLLSEPLYHHCSMRTSKEGRKVCGSARTTEVTNKRGDFHGIAGPRASSWRCAFVVR